MNTNSVELIAFVAGFFSILSAAPQMIKIIIHKQSAHVSYLTYTMLLIGGGLWVLYGVLAPSMAIVFWNSLGFMLALGVMVVKYIYK